MKHPVDVRDCLPSEFGKITHEVSPDLEIEKPYMILEEAPDPEDVIRGVFDYLNESDTRLVMLRVAISKEMAVVSYEKPVKFSTRLNLRDDVTTIVAKEKKTKVWGGRDGREVVLVRQERKIVVPAGRDPLTVARQRLLPADFRGQLEAAGRFYRRKVAGVIIDSDYRAYLLNVDQREQASGEMSGRAEVEYYGNLRYSPRGRATALADICNGVLRVSREIVTAGEHMGLVLVPKDETKGPPSSRRFR